MISFSLASKRTFRSRFVVASLDDLIYMGAHRFTNVDDLWFGMLRCWNMHTLYAALWRGAFWFCATRFTRQSDVMIVAGTLTNKMAPALRKVYDQCQSRVMWFPWVLARMGRVLSLLLFRCAWVWSHRASWYICAWLPPNRGSVALRHFAFAKENPPHWNDTAIMIMTEN